jgi:hypothetical protein
MAFRLEWGAKNEDIINPVHYVFSRPVRQGLDTIPCIFTSLISHFLSCCFIQLLESPVSYPVANTTVLESTLQPVGKTSLPAGHSRA